MFGVTLRAEDVQDLIHDLRVEKYLLAADALADTMRPFLRKLGQPYDPERCFSEYAWLLTAPGRTLEVIKKQLNGLLSPPVRQRLEKLSSAVHIFRDGYSDMVFYAKEDSNGGAMLCATVSDLTAQLQSILWSQPRPIILTSGTLAVGEDFRRFREEAGLLKDSRVTESVSPPPFDYKKNCLLYFPHFPPEKDGEGYFDQLASEITALLNAASGHALVLFTAYAAMSAVKEKLSQKELPWPLYTLGRNPGHTTEQFKADPGSILLATGATWEGFDFPGDCVSLLIIPRLPFAHPDALKEKLKQGYPSLHAFIRAIVVPEMQIKLKQGFGRAIRTEADTCVVAILDERAASGRRFEKPVKAALPQMRQTRSLKDVEAFVRRVKEDSYFLDASQ